MCRRHNIMRHKNHCKLGMNVVGFHWPKYKVVLLQVNMWSLCLSLHLKRALESHKSINLSSINACHWPLLRFWCGSWLSNLQIHDLSPRMSWSHSSLIQHWLTADHPSSHVYEADRLLPVCVCVCVTETERALYNIEA